MDTRQKRRCGHRFGFLCGLLLAAWGVGTTCAGVASSGAALGQGVSAVNPAVALNEEEELPDPNIVDVQADSLSYDAARNLIMAAGRVRVSKGLDSVEADYAEVDTVQESVYAIGNLVVRFHGSEWRGEETHFNFRTGVGDFGSFVLRKEPYVVLAEESKREDEHRIFLSGVILTTCDPDDPEYSVRAAWATLEDETIIRARHVRFQLGPVPFFYFPYIKANVHWFDNIEITPGYSSRMGAFLLTAYRHKFNDVWTSRTHLDLRSKRGVGFGEDILWEEPEGAYSGLVRGYYIDDQKPWRSERQKKIRKKLIDNERYWFRFNDRHNITDRDYLLTELNYVSDPWMLSDFFDDDYQKDVQPENRITLTHRGDMFTAGIGLVARLNDFYSNVSRLPEVSFDVNRQQIFSTPFYYESENTMSFLKKEQPKQSSSQDYDAFRLDTLHTVYWPMRHFGFLSVVPRAGYRGTYYSKTMEKVVITNVVAVTNKETGLITGTTNKTKNLYYDRPAVWRNLPEVGLESSFPAFGVLTEEPTGIEEDRGLRHVAEPYMDWTLRLKPNIEPKDLWQFDEVDKLDKENTLLLGMRNYLQTKRDDAIHDLIFLDVYTPLNLDPDEKEDEKTFNLVGAKIELKPFTPFYWNAKGEYDVPEGQIDSFDTQAGLDFTGIFQGAVDYRYKVNSRESIAADISFFPEQKWEARIYARMNIEDNQLEEHSYFLIHRTRCLGLGIGVRIRPAYDTDDAEAEGYDEEDDYSVWFCVWPLAIPQLFSDPGGT